jgi:hypothetical protein
MCPTRQPTVHARRLTFDAGELTRACLHAIRTSRRRTFTSDEAAASTDERDIGTV